MCQEADTVSRVAPPGPVREFEIPVPGGESMPATLACAAAERGPGVLLIPDIFGRSNFYDGLAFRLAGHGLHVLTPDIFFRQGPLAERAYPAALARRAVLDDRRALSDLSAALDWLHAQPEVIGARLGTLGFCLGGTFVLNLAARRTDLVSTAFYGFPGEPKNPPLNPAPIPLSQAAAVTGPLLGIWGELDEAVGIDNVRTYREALAARAAQATITIVPRVGHNFVGAIDEPENDAHAAAHEAWQVATDFLSRQLAGVGTGAASAEGGARVLVDRSRCNGYATCVFVAPEVFDLDDENISHVIGEVTAATRAQVDEAVTGCPMRAIQVTG
jgi:dienelactone hydrolase/ferredoxin